VIYTTAKIFGFADEIFYCNFFNFYINAYFMINMYTYNILSKNRVWDTCIACDGLYFIGSYLWGTNKNI